MTYRGIALLVLAIAACSGDRAAVRTSARPPSTRVEPATETLHGVAVADDYRWLEGASNSDGSNPGQMTPQVAAWTDAERRYTRAVLDSLPGRSDVEARISALMDIGDVSAPVVSGNRYFFWNRDASDVQPIVYGRDGYLGEDRELIRPADLDPGGLAGVQWIVPSPDGKLLAYAVYRSGDADGVLRVMEVDSGRRLPLEIRGSPRSLQWLPDATGFIYQRLGNPADSTSNRILFHRLGSDPSTDILLHRQFTQTENARLSATWGPFATLSRDGRWLVAGYWINPERNDLWVANFEDFRRTGRVTTKAASVGTEGRAAGTVIDGTLYLQTTKGAPNGRIVAVGASAPAEARWRDVVPERPDAQIEAVTFGRGVLAVTYLKNASNVTEVFDMGGTSLGVLVQPGIGATTLTASQDRTEAFLSFQSFNRPPTIFRVDLRAPGSPGTQWKSVSVPVDPSAVHVEQVRYTAKDGVNVSMFLVRKTGVAPNGALPTIIAGNGALGVKMTPLFTPTLFHWFESGGMLAVPNVRGGGEYGAAWRAAGARDRKQTSFDDVIAAAEWLVANRYTNADKLAVYGGASGGLLAAGALTQRPELFRAAVLLDPLLDMLRYDRWLQARYWVPEFGSPARPTEFGWLRAYSPYHRVTAGTAYPAVLLAASESAFEVHAAHARKMAARLQAATSADPAERPILLWIDRDEGVGSARSRQLQGLVDQRLFLMWQLGML